MSSDASQQKCPWCGEVVPEGAEQCPLCRRSVLAAQLRPLGGSAEPSVPVPAPPRPLGPPPSRPLYSPDDELPAPAPGQEPFGSWENVKYTMRADKAFGAVIVLLAINALLNVISVSVFHLIISIVVLWGIITFQWWGYWLAVVGAGVMTLLLGGALLSGHGAGFARGVVLVAFAINAFTLWVLYTRREHFD